MHHPHTARNHTQHAITCTHLSLHSCAQHTHTCRYIRSGHNHMHMAHTHSCMHAHKQHAHDSTHAQHTNTHSHMSTVPVFIHSTACTLTHSFAWHTCILPACLCMPHRHPRSITHSSHTHVHSTTTCVPTLAHTSPRLRYTHTQHTGLQLVGVLGAGRPEIWAWRWPWILTEQSDPHRAALDIPNGRQEAAMRGGSPVPPALTGKE